MALANLVTTMTHDVLIRSRIKNMMHLIYMQGIGFSSLKDIVVKSS